jgi:ribose transport system substrate-binding protein
MVAPVQQAVEQGIPVLIIDSGLSEQGQNSIVKYVATDNYNGGRLAAKYLAETLAKEGKKEVKVILFRYAVGSESTEQREKGFEDYIAQRNQAGEQKITLLPGKGQEVYAGATQDTAQKVAGPLLNQFREEKIDGIFAPNESSATGMLNAMRSLGLNKKVHLVGFDSSAPLVAALREGDVDALILQDPYRMGYLGVWTLVQHLEGYNVTPDGKKVQSTGENVLTRDNLDAQSTRELFEPELQAERKIDVPSFPRK